MIFRALGFQQIAEVDMVGTVKGNECFLATVFESWMHSQSLILLPVLLVDLAYGSELQPYGLGNLPSYLTFLLHSNCLWVYCLGKAPKS